MARIFAACLSVLLVGTVTATQSDAEKNRPVSKVINLLKDIIGQLEKEGEQDQEVYEQMGCWCSTNEKEKTQQIADGEGSVEDLSHAIEDLSANSARLNAEIGNLNAEVAKNEEALESATALRKKQLAEFNVEEKDMLTSLTSLKGAVVALSKHHTSFLQTSLSAKESLMMTTAVSIQHQLKKHHNLLAEVITPHQRKVVESFLQTQTTQPQSGEIFGILKAMKESFETNLSQSQKEETENAAAYEDLKKAKEQEIVAGRDLSDTKTQELANTDEKNAQSKQDLKDTRNTLAANTDYLSNLKEQCQNIDHEFEERSATRQLEIKATSEALAFLSSDEAHDLFTRTFNPALIQKTNALRSSQRDQASKVLSVAAKKSADPALSALAIKARLNGFEKVKKDIQAMVDKLTIEKEDEIKKRDYCIEEITEIDEADLTEQTRDKQDSIAAIDTLRMDRDKLIGDIEALKVQIKETELQLRRASTDREKANQEFLVVVADQRATQKLLAASLNILKGFYDKAALVQVEARTAQPAGPPPPPGFKTYEKSSSSGGVMGMMESIIADAKAMEEEAVRGEKDGQEAYEDFVKETNASLEAMNNDVTNKSEAMAKTESDQLQREKELDGTLDELEVNAKASKDIHYECDFLLKNFDIRQSTRDDEIYSLEQSLSIFSGASFGAFLQSNW